MAGAHQLLDTLLGQWKTGHDAELRVFCENGSLKVSMTANLGLWKAPPDGLWPKHPGIWNLRKESPSRQRRRERRAAERGQYFGNTSVTGKASSERAAEEIATVAAAENAMTAAGEKAAGKKVDEPEEKGYDESVSAEATGLIVAAAKVVVSVESVEEASTSSMGCKQLAKVDCWNCDSAFSPDHQCDTVSPASCSSPLPTPASIVAKAEPPPLKGLKSKENFPPVLLPLCHYCCHLGSGVNPVHYYLQCLCAERPCSCQCYCTEQQIEHKKQFFPSGFSKTLVCVAAEDRPRARAVAEERTIKLKGYRPCEDQNCISDHLSANNSH